MTCIIKICIIKEDVALALSVVSIILSICNLVDVTPFRITSDSMLSASLAIVSICTSYEKFYNRCKLLQDFYIILKG